MTPMFYQFWTKRSKTGGAPFVRDKGRGEGKGCFGLEKKEIVENDFDLSQL